MGIAEQQRRQREAYLAMVDELTDGVTSGADLVALSSRLADTHELDHKLVYRWAQLAESGIDRARKLRATVIAALFWLAFAALLVGVLGLLGWVMIAGAVAWGLVAGSVVLAALAASRLPGLRERAAAAWCEREKDGV